MRATATEQEKNAYAAGILDGEGCVGIARASHTGNTKITVYYRLRIEIVNTSIDVIAWLYQNYGGNMNDIKLIPGRNMKPTFRWDVQSDMAYQFLQKVYSYVIIKKKQVEVAFSFINRQYNEDGETFYLQMKELNKQGVKPDSKLEEIWH